MIDATEWVVRAFASQERAKVRAGRNPSFVLVNVPPGAY